MAKQMDPPAFAERRNQVGHRSLTASRRDPMCPHAVYVNHAAHSLAVGHPPYVAYLGRVRYLHVAGGRLGIPSITADGSLRGGCNHVAATPTNVSKLFYQRLPFVTTHRATQRVTRFIGLGQLGVSTDKDKK
ncbi:hypothetical protein H257_10931 [Aphanomyces astaci]|uniref:Uncharacterized protein n=1 Tax=Aphanomyces astaci TaxID=112090 RepID=W4G3S2_APHAT|nr:hypothetical protein H257_10931 [Aphanomyces astaci]ETV74340.1 hypothetical protein H257_10931 [Aphanomyces astaci]|eukprot:XP_009835998.1 hypothetical protein H257_10931 [Aphanomyces astaci]